MAIQFAELEARHGKRPVFRCDVEDSSMPLADGSPKAREDRLFWRTWFRLQDNTPKTDTPCATCHLVPCKFPMSCDNFRDWIWDEGLELKGY